MGRVRRNMVIEGRNCWTLFDTGARNTYITKDAAKLFVAQQVPEGIPVSLGGRTHIVEKTCVLIGYVEEKMVFTNANIISEIGKDEDGKPIDVLFGALAMQQWGIRPIPDEEKLDMTHYPKEFVEF